MTDTHLAVIECIDGCQKFSIAINKIRNLVQQLGSFGGWDSSPVTLKGSPSRSYSPVDIFHRCRVDFSDGLSRTDIL